VKPPINYLFADMLSNKFPARLKKVLLLEPPSFFNWAFRIIRPLIPGKYLDKLATAKLHDLQSYVDPDRLLVDYGGMLTFDASLYIDSLWSEEQQQLGPQANTYVLPANIGNIAGFEVKPAQNMMTYTTVEGSAAR
jgi:hypothetical protein